MICQMARWWSSPEPDESFLQFRERSVRDGAWLTYVVALVVGGYAVATWDRPHRAAVLALLGIAGFGGYVITPLPAPAVLRPRRRAPFLLPRTAAARSVIALLPTRRRRRRGPLRAPF